MDLHAYHQSEQQHQQQQQGEQQQHQRRRSSIPAVPRLSPINSLPTSPRSPLQRVIESPPDVVDITSGEAGGGGGGGGDGDGDTADAKRGAISIADLLNQPSNTDASTYASHLFVMQPKRVVSCM
jgi:hypothetical protein